MQAYNKINKKLVKKCWKLIDISNKITYVISVLGKSTKEILHRRLHPPKGKQK